MTVRPNGQTEAQVQRLKLLKRAMYGQAGFELLRKRVLIGTSQCRSSYASHEHRNSWLLDEVERWIIESGTGPGSYG